MRAPGGAAAGGGVTQRTPESLPTINNFEGPRQRARVKPNRDAASVSTARSHERTTE